MMTKAMMTAAIKTNILHLLCSRCYVEDFTCITSFVHFYNRGTSMPALVKKQKL